MLGWWRRRLAYREQVREEASALIEWLGAGAYRQARDYARLKSDQQSRFWTAVALEIARRQGREIGLDTATRYLDGNSG